MIALSQFRVSLTAVLFLTSLAACAADPAPVIRLLGENLEHVDVALIDRAEHEVDMAAYVLTDWAVMQALTRAADRGVKVRVYLDGTQIAEREPAKVFRDLAETPGVEIRIKRKRSALMHLKSYQIDGKLLRTGAANFSASGLKRQDNDLIVIESPGAATIKRNFEARARDGKTDMIFVHAGLATVESACSHSTAGPALLTIWRGLRANSSRPIIERPTICPTDLKSQRPRWRSIRRRRSARPSRGDGQHDKGLEWHQLANYLAGATAFGERPTHLSSKQQGAMS